MTDSLPNITEETIQKMSSDKSYDRGYRYYRSGAIFDPVRQGNQLIGYCEGSQYQPYRVSAELGPSGIERINCTCPYDWGGICKHQVALLLTWVNQPDKFHTTPPLDQMLNDRSKEDLIVLIKEMLKREPDLRRLVELPVQPDRNSPLDLAAYRRQINYALNAQGDDYDYYYAAQETAGELASLVDTADRFLEGGDWANAGALYALILAEVVPNYEELYDENGDVAVELQRCAEGLDTCFEQGSPDADTRRVWLEALVEAEMKDIEMGGIDLAYPASDVFVNRATDDEWEWIEARLKSQLSAGSGYSSDWRREVIVGLLSQRLDVTGHSQQADDLIAEMGSPRQQAFLLIEQKRFDEAVDVARLHFNTLPGLVTQFADALVAAGGGAQAEAYVSSLVTKREGRSYVDWLAKRAEETGQLTTALNWWRESLKHSPSLKTYQTIRQVAEKLQQWDTVRPELLAELERHDIWHLLVEIALEEDDVLRAVELLPKVKGWYSRDFELRVARAAEKELPRAAFEIYCRRAEALIDQRGRQNYAAAADLLLRVRDICDAQNDRETWANYITEVRKKYPTLRALQDELTKAGL